MDNGRKSNEIEHTPQQPPAYPVDASEALRIAGKYPKPRKERAGKLSTEQRMQLAIAGAMAKMRKDWRLTAWKDPNSRAYMFDREEIERKKQARWKVIHA